MVLACVCVCRGGGYRGRVALSGLCKCVGLPVWLCQIHIVLFNRSYGVLVGQEVVVMVSFCRFCVVLQYMLSQFC